MSRILAGEKGRVIGEALEVKGLREDGRVIPIELTLGHRIHDGEHYFSAIMRDITRRKRIEKQIEVEKQNLVYKHEQFQAITGSETDAIITSDETRTITNWNKGAERLFGYHESEVLGKDIKLIIPENLRQPHDDGMTRVIERSEFKVMGETLELSAIKKDGSEFPIELTLGYWKSENKFHFSGIIRDISIRKRNERLIQDQHRQIVEEKERSDRLLGNILPAPLIGELKERGGVNPKQFESVSILFTDIVGFTGITENRPAQELVSELNEMFSYFDRIARKNNLEKLKTIGDSYMCAGGIPRANDTHAVDCVRAAIQFLNFVKTKKRRRKSPGRQYWDIRIGIHTGPVVAGVVGDWKFSYDIWGDSVNVASRMESSGLPGKINLSAEAYRLVEQFFVCEHRGKIQAKNKGAMEMYILKSIRPELSVDGAGKQSSPAFLKRYKELSAG